MFVKFNFNGKSSKKYCILPKTTYRGKRKSINKHLSRFTAKTIDKQSNNPEKLLRVKSGNRNVV